MTYSSNKIITPITSVEEEDEDENLKEQESEESDEYTNESANEDSAEGSEHESDDELEPPKNQFTNPNSFFVRTPPRPRLPPSYQEALLALEEDKLQHQLAEEAANINLQTPHDDDKSISCLTWFL